MRCPECDKKRLTSFLYGNASPKRVHYCKKCEKIFYIKIVEVFPYICYKCNKPIISDIGKMIFLANGKVKHKRCPRKINGK